MNEAIGSMSLHTFRQNHSIDGSTTTVATAQSSSRVQPKITNGSHRLLSLIFQTGSLSVTSMRTTQPRGYECKQKCKRHPTHEPLVFHYPLVKAFCGAFPPELQTRRTESSL